MGKCNKTCFKDISQGTCEISGKIELIRCKIALKTDSESSKYNCCAVFGYAILGTGTQYNFCAVFGYAILGTGTQYEILPEYRYAIRGTGTQTLDFGILREIQL